MWTHDPSHGAFALELDYPGYLDALLATKGFYGWQFLHTDIRLAEHPALADLIRTNLDFVTRALPAPGHGELEARFAARMG